MPFPTTPILDNFNRADVAGPTPDDNNWLCLIDTSYEPDACSHPTNAGVISNQMAAWCNIYTSGIAILSWWKHDVGPDSEAFIKVAAMGNPNTVDQTAFYLNLGVRTDRRLDWAGNGYYYTKGYIASYVIYNDTGTKYTELRLYRMNTNGTLALLAEALNQSPHIVVGDELGIQAIGSTIKVWRKPSGGSWTEILSVTDTTWTQAGKLFVYALGGEVVDCSPGLSVTEVRLDDFGGGDANTLFPTTGILDNFNRANEGPPPSANWTNNPALLFPNYDNGLKVVSNQAAGQSGLTDGSYWNAQTFGPDQEVYATLSVLPANIDAVGLYLRLASIPSSDYAGYFLEFGRDDTNGDFLKLRRLDGVANATLLSNNVVVMTAGDSFGMSAIDSSIRIFHKPSGGSWVLVATVVDATYDRVGRIAANISAFNISTLARLDDFGGGTYVPPANYPPTITTTNLGDGVVGTAYSQTVQAISGTTPYTWTISSGSLPTGLNINQSTGAITGTPTTIEIRNFTVKCTGSNGLFDTQTLSIAIYGVLNIITTSLPDGVVGQGYSQTLQRTGGKTPITWSILSGSLPPNLGLAGSTGLISGTPTTSGIYNFTVKIVDSTSTPQEDTQALSITILTGVPFAPTNLNVEILATSRRLTWTDNANNEDDFVIERRTAAGSWAQYTTVGANTTTFTDSNLGGQYQYYRVKARNVQGSSPYSNIGPVPQAPNLVTVLAHSVDPNRIDMYWDDNTFNEDYFQVERSIDGNNFNYLNQVGSNVRTYRDLNCAPATQYWYRVAAYDPLFGLSDYSNVLSDTTVPEGGGPEGGGGEGEGPGGQEPPWVATGGPSYVINCPNISAEGPGARAVKVTGVAYLLHSRLVADEAGTELEVDANSYARVLASQYSRSTGAGFINPLHGDRSVWDTDNYPGRHAKDIADGVLSRHLPTATATGQAPIWDGTKWVAADVATQAELDSIPLISQIFGG